MKQKIIKNHSKKPLKNKKQANWNKIKLEENIFTEDNLAFDGFVNLEVLENYDTKLVRKVKQSRDDIDLRSVDRLAKKNSDNNQEKVIKLDADTSKEEDEIFAEFEEFEFDHVPMKRKREDDSGDDDDDDENANKKSKKKKKKRARKEKHTPGQFVLLKTPVNGKESNEKQENGKGKKDKTLDNLGAEVTTESTNSINIQNWSELGVPEEVLKAITDKNYFTPTEIQTLTIPPAIMGKRDILGAAETGSGKTLAFAIPIIDGILKARKQEEEKSNKLFALILTPTRELASQIEEHIQAMTKYTDIKTISIFGGLAAVKQKRMLSQSPEIIIATPGRLWELIEEGVDHLKQIDQIKYLVVDETDRMLEKGHFEELHKILEVLNQDPDDANNRQNFIFSATLTMVHDLPDYVIKRSRSKGHKPLKCTPGQKLQQVIEAFGVKNPKIVDITSMTGTARKLTESRVLCPQNQKDVFLYYFLKKHPGRTIVFCNSIESVRRLVSILEHLDCIPLGLHGSMAQKQRLKNIDRFKKNPLGLLIATDVAARGLDIPLVEHVIHYHVPKTTETYIHRSGRTARANNEGLAILIMEASEVKLYKKLYEDLGRTEDLPLFPTETRPFRMAQERVNLAREIEVYHHRQHKESADENWVDNLAKEAGLNSDSSDHSSDDEDERKVFKSKEKRGLREKSIKLAKMLQAPMFENVTKYPTLSNVVEKLSAVDTVKKVVVENKEWNEKRSQNQKPTQSKKQTQGHSQTSPKTQKSSKTQKSFEKKPFEKKPFQKKSKKLKVNQRK